MRSSPSRRLAWWLVRAYPPRFRRDVGLGLVDTLDDRMRASHARGSALPVVWVRAIADTARNAPLEWLRTAVDSLGNARNALKGVPYNDTASVVGDNDGHTYSAARDGLRAVPKSPVVVGDALQGVPRRTFMDKLLQDVRYAIRLWMRKPAVALVAILTLALGIGANTAMFSIVNAVLLRPLPFPDADRLVSLWGRTQANPRTLLSIDEYRAIAAEKKTFEAAALWLGQSVNLTGVSEPQRIVGNFVSGSFFDVFQLKAERGRLFSEAETPFGSAEPVVVISHAFWEKTYQSDPAAIGAKLTLNGTPLTVIGVMAAPFDLKSVPSDGYFVNYDVFMPLGLFPVPSNVPRTVLNAQPSMLGVARLRPNVALATAEADVTVVMQRLDAANPGGKTGRSGLVVFAVDDIVGNSRTSLLLLLASVAVVLLIACVNVSNLLVARAVDRQKEMAVRAALGAGRLAVFRQLSVEAALLSIVSTAAGFGVGRWALRALETLPPSGVPIPTHIPLDSAVLAFTVGVAVAVAIACGFAPAIKISRPDLNRVLQAGGRRSTGGAARTRDTLVVAEIALSAALLAVAGLLIQSLLALQRIDVGFDSANVFSLQFRLPVSKYAKPDDIARFFTQSIERVRAVPGVESAALVRRVPLSFNWGDTPFTVDGQNVAKGSEPRATENIVSPDYFRTMRIPMLQGRDFSDRDDMTTPPVVVVNQAFARTFWPDTDPIGQRIRLVGNATMYGPRLKEPVTVIGVVGNVKHRTPTEPVQPQLYLAHYQAPMIFSSIVARTAVAPLTLTRDIRRAIWTVDKDQPLWAVAALDGIVASSHGAATFTALLLGILAAVAVVLACVGIYGVMSYAVTERTHEIGIRMALGASADRVLRDIVGRGLQLTGIALAIGVPGAVAIARLARGALFGVGPGDPLTLGGAAVLLGTVSIAACYFPARRASRVDPVVALAEE